MNIKMPEFIFPFPSKVLAEYFLYWFTDKVCQFYYGFYCIRHAFAQWLYSLEIVQADDDVPQHIKTISFWYHLNRTKND